MGDCKQESCFYYHSGFCSFTGVCDHAQRHMFDPQPKIYSDFNDQRHVIDEIEVNSKGGAQSKLDVRYDLIDPIALKKLAHTLYGGCVKYGKDNWRKIDSDSHLNHALNHIYLYFENDESEEDHLSHAFCRLMMAIAMREEEKE